MPRPSALTPELQFSICRTLADGVDLKTACMREGISQTTFYEWCKRGKAGEQPFEEFMMATDVARAQCEVDVTRNIITASKRRWQAGAWWLKWQHTRGVNRIELTGRDGQPLQSSTQLTVQSADEIRRQILFGNQAPKALAAGSSESAEQAQLAREREVEREISVMDEDDDGAP